jgi:hypothetical protein
MGIHNSLGEFYLSVYEHLHRDVVGATACVRKTESDRDIETIRRRFHAEGLSLFTKTFPRLAKAVDLALATSNKLQFSSFAKKKGTELPAFCWWLFSLVFDDAGRERSDACPVALAHLRQILTCCYKLELPYDEQTTEKVISEFVSTDEHLAFRPDGLTGVTDLIAKRARTLVLRVMSGLSPWDIIPRHGPGVVATGEKLWEKTSFRRIYSVMQQMYPFTEYFYYNSSHLCDRLDELQSMRIEDAGTAKVVLVPKDSRGPRLISCEPLENQWIQQGQMRAIVPHLESHWLTRGLVNFTDQTINQRLALQASRDGSLATLDMKEASDRVSWELVEFLFPKHWADALYATRSVRTTLPDGRVVQLNKFAPMGSAVCFPVEALVFWALCAASVSVTRNIGLVKASRTIYVYGDDIICRSEDQAAIRQHLPSFDLLVNEGKCCTGMTFKESCGCDAYRGVDVTPTKFRRVWSPHLTAESYESYVAYSNALYDRGYYGVAEYIERCIQKIHKTPYFNEVPRGGIGFVRAHVAAHKENQRLRVPRRFNKKLQRLEVLALCSKARIKFSPSSDWEELLRVSSYTPLHSQENSWEPIELVVARQYALRRRNYLQRCWTPFI